MQTPCVQTTTDIFVKTCLHDREYHKYCLASIDKFCSGFRNTVVVEGEHPKGYLHQQVVKMHADDYTDADYILITDSDTLFNQPVTPESFMVDGKPIWIHTPWTQELLDHKGTATWKRVMEEFMGQSPGSEFMRRQPFVFPRHVFKSLRKLCVERHGVDLETYIMRSNAFSEFNVMGFHCWLHHHDDFHWIDSSKEELPPMLCHQAWSHDPIEKNIPIFEKILNQ